jgi:hypothetical protein
MTKNKFPEPYSSTTLNLDPHLDGYLSDEERQSLSVLSPVEEIQAFQRLYMIVETLKQRFPENTQLDVFKEQIEWLEEDLRTRPHEKSTLQHRRMQLRDLFQRAKINIPEGENNPIDEIEELIFVKLLPGEAYR